MPKRLTLQGTGEMHIVEQLACFAPVREIRNSQYYLLITTEHIFHETLVFRRKQNSESILGGKKARERKTPRETTAFASAFFRLLDTSARPMPLNVTTETLFVLRLAKKPFP